MICPSGGECDNPGCRHGGCQGRRPSRHAWRWLALALCAGARRLRGGRAGAVSRRPAAWRRRRCGGGGPAEACDGGGSGVCAAFQNGQTFITWIDSATGAAGANFRYRVYRSTSPITSGNYAAATLIASYVINNSGQLFGGDPNNSGANGFTAVLPPDIDQSDGGAGRSWHAAAPFTGLQVYTALGYRQRLLRGRRDRHERRLAVLCRLGRADRRKRRDADRLQGRRQPRARPELWQVHRDDQPPGRLTRATSRAPTAGCNSVQCQWATTGICALTTGRGLAGRPPDRVRRGRGRSGRHHYPSLPRSIEMRPRDTIIDSLGLLGIGDLPHRDRHDAEPACGAGQPLLSDRPAIRPKKNSASSCRTTTATPTTFIGSGRAWAPGAARSTGIRMTSPTRFASMWLAYPVWRHDRRSTGNWPGKTWSSSMPFRATTAAAPSTLGTTASSVLMSDGSTWGGSGGYADTPSFIAANPGDDLPFTVWAIGKYDPYPVSFLEQIEAVAAFTSAASRVRLLLGDDGAREHSQPACRDRY